MLLGVCGLITICGHVQASEPRTKPKIVSNPKLDCPELTVDEIEHCRFKRVLGSAYGGACLDTGTAGSWYSDTVSTPTVDFNGDVYRMWFVGGAPTDDPAAPYGRYEQIGLATSRDGIDWTLANEGKPVLGLGPPGSADAKGLAHPYVLKVGQTFLMWYGGIDGKQAGDIGLSPRHVRIERICLATSHDGIRWQRANSGRPVMDIGRTGSIDSIQATGMHVLKIGDAFVMWYGAYDGHHSLGMAKSRDGVHWTKANQGRSLSGLQGKEQLGPSVYFDGRRYFMLYNRPLNNSWVTFAATSENGTHWKPAYDGKPVLGVPPTGNFGTAGSGRNHSVHPSQFVILGRKARVWYSAEDGSAPHHQRTGLMEAVLP